MWVCMCVCLCVVQDILVEGPCPVSQPPIEEHFHCNTHTYRLSRSAHLEKEQRWLPTDILQDAIKIKHHSRKWERKRETEKCRQKGDNDMDFCPFRITQHIISYPWPISHAQILYSHNALIYLKDHSVTSKTLQPNKMCFSNENFEKKLPFNAFLSYLWLVCGYK